MAGKYIKGIASMEEKAKQVIHKYEKRQPLSDLEQQYNFRQLRPTLSVPIDADDRETHLAADRPSGSGSSCCSHNPTPASEPCDDAEGAAADATGRSPLSPCKNQRRSPSHSPAVRKKLHTWVRPATADSAAFRPKYGERSDMQFAMETGVGKVVAVKLARGFSAGIGVRVGKNGSAVRTESFAGSDDASVVKKSAAGFNTAGTTMNAGFNTADSQPVALTSMLMTSPQPLSMEDAAKMYRIVVAQHPPPTPESVVSETLPVIFNEAGESKPYVPFSIRVDSEAFKQQLAQLKTVELHDPTATVLSLCKPNDVSLGVTYEEVLTIRAPTSSALRRELLQLPAESPPPPPHNPPTTAATALRVGRETPSGPAAPTAAATPAPGASALREEFRRCMRRQVTMPSYTVVRDVGVRGSRQSPADGGGGGVAERGRRHRARLRQQQQQRAAGGGGGSPRPPHSSLAFHKAFGPTVPTITPNGVQGPRQYVALTADVLRAAGRRRDAPDSRHGGRSYSPDVAAVCGSASPPTRRSANCDSASAMGAVESSSVDVGPSSFASSAMTIGGGGRNTVASSSSCSGGGRGSGSFSHRASLAISSRGGGYAASNNESRSSRRSRLSSSSEPPSSYDDRAAAAHETSSTTDVGSPASWRRQVSIPTGAGTPSEASDDDDSCGAENDRGMKSEAAGSGGAKALNGAKRSGADACEANENGQLQSPPQPTQLGQRGEATWRGGPEELRAMRAYIQEDLARTRIEAKRMAESLNARQRRSTSGHLLAQEWLS